MDTQCKLKITDLDLFYGDFQALSNVSMDINANEVMAFIGPSGCGKSTFIKTINRMNDLIPDVTIKGKVLYDGVDIYKDYDVIELRKRIGMVFQKPNPFPMTVYDNIAYGPRIHGIRDKKKLDDIVEMSLKGSGALGRGGRPAAQARPGSLRRPAAAPLYRPGAGGGARRGAHG